MFSQTKEKWAYKIRSLDQPEHQFELMYDNVFFVDFEFLEKKFGISFSNLESYYANNKNTIILKIAQISTGICIGNCSCQSILSREIAFKFNEEESWKEFMFLDNINIEPGQKILVLINSYKILIYDVCLNSGNVKKKYGEKTTAFETFKKTLNMPSISEMQNDEVGKNEKKEERELIKVKLNEKNQPEDQKEQAQINEAKKRYDDSPKIEQSTIESSLENVINNKEKFDQNDKINQPNDKKLQHENTTDTKNKDKKNQDDDDIGYVERCLMEYYSQEESKKQVPEKSDHNENSCFEYFGHHFDLPDLVSEKPSQNSFQNDTKENKDIEEDISNKKKRRMTNFGDEEELFKNLRLNKKKFKFDSPVFISKSDSMLQLQNESHLQKKEKENCKENFEEHTKENDSKIKKNKRLKKLKEIQDENTCPICLDLISQDKGYLPCNHFFCSQCIQDWSQVTNCCPLCKSEFREIEIKSKESNPYLIKVNPKKQRSDHYDDDPEEYDESDDLCYICDTGENTYLLLVCDSCKYFCCHTYCLDPPLNYIPEGEWICTYCQRERDNSRSFSFNMRNFFNQGSRRNNNNNGNNGNAGNRNNNGNTRSNNGGRSNNNQGRSNNNRRRAIFQEGTDNFEEKCLNTNKENKMENANKRKDNIFINFHTLSHQA